MRSRSAKHAVRLSGGIGNQLFQAAYGLALRERTGQEVELDATWFDLAHDRDLSNFERPRLAELGFCALPIRNSLVGRRGTGAGKVLNIVNRQVFARTGYSFGPLLHVGYWQSENHFAEIFSEVAGSLSLPAPTSPESRRTEAKIRSSRQSVSVHVRRGDYLKTDAMADCSSLYQRRAIAQVDANADVFLFSDDIEHCKTEFADLEGATFVDDSASDLEDMSLMSLCDSHVIANSSFSWWAAWIGEQRATGDCRVIAPTPWFNLDGMDRRLRRYLEPDTIIPERWTVLADPGASQ